MSLPRLVALDVDGTLRNPSDELTDRTRAAVHAMHGAGAIICIATGRPWNVAQTDVTELGDVVSWAICSNGATTVRVADGVVTSNAFLDDEEPTQIVRDLRGALPGVGIGFEFQHVSRSEDGWARRLPGNVDLGYPVDDVLTLLRESHGPVRRVVAWHDDYDDRQLELRDVVADGVASYLVVEATGLSFCDIGMPGVSKAIALQRICDDLAIGQTDVVAFGDQSNDRDMLAWAGTGVAMGNATDEVKASANHQTLTNAEDGVAVFLNNLLEINT